MLHFQLEPAHTNTHDYMLPSLTGALGLYEASSFFNGTTYFGHNSAKEIGGEKMFESTYDIYDVPHTTPLRATYRRR